MCALLDRLGADSDAKGGSELGPAGHVMTLVMVCRGRKSMSIGSPCTSKCNPATRKANWPAPSELLSDFVLVFMDDILIFSKSAEDHQQHLRILFEVLRKEKTANQTL